MPKDRTLSSIIDTARRHAIHLASQLKQLELRANGQRPPSVAQVAHLLTIHTSMAHSLATLHDAAAQIQDQTMATLLRHRTAN